MNKVIFAQSVNVDLPKIQLTFIDESGFVTKEEGLAFLLSNSLIDTTKNSKDWNRINQIDTIGRYYRIKNNDNYLMCLPYSLDFFKPMYLLLEVTYNGQLIKSEKYNLGGSARWNNYYRNFIKYDSIFFSISAQGGFGAGQYFYWNMYLFKELLPQDSISYIPFSEEKILVKNRNTTKTIVKRYGCISMQIINNELLANYTLNKGKMSEIEGKYNINFRRHTEKNISIKYFYENEKWSTNDTDKLEEMKQFMKVVSPYRFL